MAAVDVDAVAVAAPFVVEVAALHDGFVACGFQVICAELGGAVGALPGLIGAAVAAVVVVWRIVAEAVVHALPIEWAA